MYETQPTVFTEAFERHSKEQIEQISSLWKSVMSEAGELFSSAVIDSMIQVYEQGISDGFVQGLKAAYTEQREGLERVDKEEILADVIEDDEMTKGYSMDATPLNKWLETSIHIAAGAPCIKGTTIDALSVYLKINKDSGMSGLKELYPKIPEEAFQAAYDYYKEKYVEQTK